MARSTTKNNQIEVPAGCRGDILAGSVAVRELGCVCVFHESACLVMIEKMIEDVNGNDQHSTTTKIGIEESNRIRRGCLKMDARAQPFHSFLFLFLLFLCSSSFGRDRRCHFVPPSLSPLITASNQLSSHTVAECASTVSTDLTHFSPHTTPTNRKATAMDRADVDGPLRSSLDIDQADPGNDLNEDDDEDATPLRHKVVIASPLKVTNIFATMDSSSLSNNLRTAEETLAKLQAKERKLHRKQQQDSGDDFVENGSDSVEGDSSSPTSTIAQLMKLQGTVDSLALMRDYTEFLGRSTTASQGNSGSVESDVILQARLCMDLAESVLLRHAENILEICHSLYEEAYLPLFHYVHEHLVILLRQELQSSRYPHPKGCDSLLKQTASGHLTQICHSLTQLETTHGQVLRAVEGALDVPHNITVLLELFHPLLDRVYFHFVDSGQHDTGKSDQGRLTATRIDRLPELLLKYIRESFLVAEGGDDNNSNSARPFQVIAMVDPSLLVPFAQELIRLIQWILVDQRNFFDDPAIAGLKSNPLLLYNAMEHFLEFDAALKATVSRSAWNASEDIMASQSNSTAYMTSTFMGLMDTLVVPNNDLLDWWILREREYVFSTLFPLDDETKNDDVPKPLANHVSPRAEVFCALIRSVQFKAATLAGPRKYLQDVAVPLCSQFVDALHETSVDLRNLLLQKQPQSLLVESQIVSNVHEWIEIINGAVLASQVLLSKERKWQYKGSKSTVSAESDHDLARFGRSLERLVDAMVDEFASAFVETILMERAKLASYLMLSSHLLSSEEWDADDVGSGLSVELKDTKVVLLYLQQVCNSILGVQAPNDEGRSILSGDYAQDNVATFAPSKMLIEVISRVADKFLEVALDVNHVTPNIWTTGAMVFARDVQSILGSFKDIVIVSRLLEVTKLMTMNFGTFQGLFEALGGLVGSVAFLDLDEFVADATLRDEASQMLKAKNVHCPLEDAISILNRRRE